jgi:hypothetical protein
VGNSYLTGLLYTAHGWAYRPFLRECNCTYSFFTILVEE